MKAEARVLRSALMYERLRKQALQKPDKVKGFLGPSLREDPSVPSLGRRVAMGRGLIVDENGKMRCPAGTPNANQFTDLQMSNCMIPSAETAVNEAVDAIGNAIQQVAEQASETNVPSARYTPSPDSTRIRKKNDEILSSLRAQGGQIEDLTPEYIERETKDVVMSSGMSAAVITKEEHTRRRRELVRDNIDVLKRAVAMRDNDEPLSAEETMEILTSGRNISGGMMTGHVYPLSSDEARDEFARGFLLNIFGGTYADGVVRRGYSPELIRMIREDSPEDIEAALERATRSFHEGLDPRVHVQIPEERLAMVFTDGRYKTTHEARSMHSGPHSRVDYEVIVGIPRSATADVRPASGFVVHSDWQKSIDADRAERAEKLGSPERVTADDILVDNSMYGQVGVYGGITLRLKPEVSERSRYGWGDSFNNTIDPVPMNPGADIDEIQNALISRRYKNGSRSDNMSAMLDFLDAHNAGDFSKIRPTRGEEGARVGDINYAEALVFGSFELSDIEEIEMPFNSMPWYPQQFFSQQRYDNSINEDVNNFADSLQALFEHTMSPAMLRQMGASEEEVQVIQKWIDDYLTDVKNGKRPRLPQSGDGFGEFDLINMLTSYVSMLSMSEFKETASRYGIRVKTTSPNGIDRWNIGNYSEADQKIGDVMEVWRRRVGNTAISDARKQIERKNNPPTGVPRT